MGLGSVLKKKSMEYLEWWVIHSMITRLGDKRIGTTKNIFFDNLARGDNLKSIKLEIVSCAWNTTQVSGINISNIYIFPIRKYQLKKMCDFAHFLFIVFFFPPLGTDGLIIISEFGYMSSIALIRHWMSEILKSHGPLWSDESSLFFLFLACVIDG